MASNAVLEYIDLICSTRYSTKHHFFTNKKSFDTAEPSPTRVLIRADSSRDLTESPYDLFLKTDSPNGNQNLPIHAILKDIYDAVKENNASYFEPMILHYWQLQRLLEILRCNTKVLAIPAEIRANNGTIVLLRKEIDNLSHPDLRRAKEGEIRKLEKLNTTLQEELVIEQNALHQQRRPQDKENLQAVLVLSTLLNVIYRQGMSVPLLSDQFRIETQQHESRALLKEYFGMEFNLLEEAFSELFAQHMVVQTVQTVPERARLELREDWAWLLGHSPILTSVDGALKNAQFYVSRVLGAQTFHAYYNHFRLGGTRTRRFLAFLEPFLQNETYTAVFKTVDPYFRFVLGYLNWIFFIPRLSLNLSLLTHHLLNDPQLEPMERKLSHWTRFRVHWTRFWFELINDCYWILNGLKLCFWLPGGALSPQGIFLSLTIQSLDVVCSIIRAGIELHRLYKMSSDFDKLQPNHALKKDMNKRFWFEVFALGYMVFHFTVLLLSLCLTLPKMAAISLAWPVVGGFTAVLITIATFYMQRYLASRRELEFECRPKPVQVDSSLARFPSSQIGETLGGLNRRTSHIY